MRRVLLALLAVAVLAGGRLLYDQSAARSDTGPGRPAMAVVVRAKAARTGDMDVYVTGLGTVTAANSVTVQSRVDGQLMALHFTEGRHVRAGDLLAEIDPRPYKAALAEAEGTLAKDEAQLKAAQKDLARYRVLLTQDSISPQQVDTTQGTVRQYEGAVKADRASVESAKVNLAYCRITAPCSGRLGLRQVDPGNIVSANSTDIVVITQVQPIDVVFTIPETRLPEVLTALRQGKAEGQPLAVEAWNRENTQKVADGVLLTLDNRIDTSTGTVKLKARFANADEMLFPNQFVNARLRVRTLSGAVLIPDAAVQQGSSGPFVYVVGKDGKARLTKITEGPSGNGLVAVSDGVSPGDELVVDGVDNLRDKTPVDVAAD
ncbi:MdtA/MuxA family multidrug efflux RND transporter periplasmic adaptor subunit [Desulfovibrio sp. X2]|uniref:MdtA/MuxA family multidrug efflux RND transporter periplasmic adaptor subunit n=1 Tax=Desulfovibrio sp. X2 TaxID=941449 RepID=UPI00155B243E|nr:MdtA/MuxA family multidrug efflux RND transporter periplasmic adaptor subunit [Desulfovibrio sp. X2]